MCPEDIGLELFRGGRTLSEQIAVARNYITMLLCDDDLPSRPFFMNLEQAMGTWINLAERMEKQQEVAAQAAASKSRLLRYRTHP